MKACVLFLESDSCLRTQYGYPRWPLIARSWQTYKFSLKSSCRCFLRTNIHRWGCMRIWLRVSSLYTSRNNTSRRKALIFPLNLIKKRKLARQCLAILQRIKLRIIKVFLVLTRDFWLSNNQIWRSNNSRQDRIIVKQQGKSLWRKQSMVRSFLTNSSNFSTVWCRFRTSSRSFKPAKTSV